MEAPAIVIEDDNVENAASSSDNKQNSESSTSWETLSTTTDEEETNSWETLSTTTDEEETYNGSDDSRTPMITASKIRYFKIKRAKRKLEYAKQLLFTEFDYSRAVAALKSVRDEYCSLYGELGRECGEVFMLYGLALILRGKKRNQVRRPKNNGCVVKNCKKRLREMELVDDRAENDGVIEKSIEEGEGDAERAASEEAKLIAKLIARWASNLISK